LSEPTQDIGGELEELVFPSRRSGNASEEDDALKNEIANEVEDASLLDLVEGAAGITDIDLQLGELDDDAPNMVRSYSCSR
jgi:hypothetical protein